MAKRATAYELMLSPRNADVPAYGWLYGALRAEILEGRLRPGARLEATRELAARYGLARGTIVNAFELLKSEGYLEGSAGSGTFVSKVLPEELLEVRQKASARVAESFRPRRRISEYGKRVRLFSGYEMRPSRAFRSNLPALELFPTALWAQIAARRWRGASANLLRGCDALGYRSLRDAVADYLGASRGVKCSGEQIAIVSGVQEALDIVARLFLNPGDSVCMENPGYTGAAYAFRAVGARIRAVPVDEEGIELGSGNLRGARLIYVTPGHQFPLGITMSLGRRLALLAAARKIGALIFEDDYDSEFRYSGRPVPALQGLDEHGVVLFAGSFSKVLFPSLRVGYLVIPRDLLGYFEAVKSVTSRHAPPAEQAILCDFIVEGHFGRHLRRMREVYAEKLSVLLGSARERLGGLLEISGIEAGLQTVGWLRGGLGEERVAAAAAMRDVEVTPVNRYSLGKPVPDGLQIGFAAVDAKEIRRGVEELAIAIEGEREKSMHSLRRGQRTIATGGERV